MSPERAAAGAKVLVVDDNPFVRRLVAGRLRKAGCTIAEAQDGHQALEACHQNPPQVVITDINMPGLRGLDLLARLRSQPVPPEVILLTGTHADDAAAAVQALRLGAHDFIAKDALAGEAVELAVERAIEKWRLREENARLLGELRRLSLTDPLTGAGNRRAFDQAACAEIARTRRSGSDLALVALDIDHFKRVNDEWGHAAGDSLLVSFVDRLAVITRAGDRLYRTGGEEFVLLLPDTNLDGAVRVADRAVARVHSAALDAGRGALPITCSAGVASLAPSDDGAGSTLLERADAALYAAKGAGRNRVAVAASVAARPTSAAASATSAAPAPTTTGTLEKRAS